MKKRAHVYIYGDVIGVGFRAWTVHVARSLNLVGWVKNAGSKTVEAVFEGEKENLDKMIDSCHKGPEVSWVEKVDIHFEESTNEFSKFEIRR